MIHALAVYDPHDQLFNTCEIHKTEKA